jgi:two-component system nitrate/nitrite response regulator NarL
VIRVFIVAEVRLYREGLADVLGREPSIDIVGAAEHQDQALSQIRELAPDITLLDSSLPDPVMGVRRLLSAASSMKVVAIAVRDIEMEIVTWAEAGISGYVSGDGSLADLVMTIESVARDEMPCSARLAATLVRHIQALAARTDGGWPGAALTHRELEIVDLIQRGLSNKEIARALHVAVPTVKNHAHSIFEKLQVHRRADALARLGRQFQLTTTGH